MALTPEQWKKKLSDIGLASIASGLKAHGLVGTQPIAPWAQQRGGNPYVNGETYVKGKGGNLWVENHEGQPWLETTAGYGCYNKGRDWTPAAEAAQKLRANGLGHFSSDVYHPSRHVANQKLIEATPMSDEGRCYFVPTGNLAVDAAYTFMRYYLIKQKRTSAQKIIGFTSMYAGASSALPSRITGEPDRRLAWESQCPGVTIHVPHPEVNGDVEKGINSMIEAIKKEGPENFAAIHLEGGGITATSGGYTVPQSYMQELFAFAKKHDILVLADETYSGFGRTGKLFGIQHYEGCIPDVMCGAKALTNGEGTSGWVAMKPEIGSVFDDAPMPFGCTFFAAPPDMAAAAAVLDHYKESDATLVNANKVGAHIKKSLTEKLGNTPFFGIIRQTGMMIIMELKNPKTGEPFSNLELGVLKMLLASPEYRVIAMGRKDKLMMTPYLDMTIEEADRATNSIEKALKQMFDM